MEIETDYLVIGSGIAGLTFALQAAVSGRVAIVTKKESAEASTNYAQGGIASVFDLDDSFDLHLDDTLKSGDGLCDEEIVRMVVPATKNISMCVTSGTGVPSGWATSWPMRPFT